MSPARKPNAGSTGDARRLKCAGAAGVLLGLAACGRPAPVGERPRGVLVITVDTLRADRVGCYGNPRGLTPAIDRLAAEGTRFANAIAPIPCTLPSHTSLFTGLSPWAHGISDNFRALPTPLTTLAEVLSGEGFACAAFFNIFPFDALNLSSQGFAAQVFDPSKRAERIVPAFTTWLGRRRPGERWLAWVHLFIPHGPLDPPEKQLRTFLTHPYSGPLDDRFETLEAIRVGQLAASDDFVANYRDRYDAAVAFADEQVGRLREALEAAGLLDDVLVVLVADHGESLERGVIGLHSPVLAQSTLHVPLVLRGPGVPAGRTVTELVQHPDLFPTVLAGVHVAMPGAIDGRSLWPIMDGHAEGWNDRALSFLPTQFRGKGKTAPDPERAAVRVGPWELVLVEGGGKLLYDLTADPEEEHDVAAEQADVVRRMEAVFKAAVASEPPASPGMREQLRNLGYPVS